MDLPMFRTHCECINRYLSDVIRSESVSYVKRLVFGLVKENIIFFVHRHCM
jgi:hypothetical protein